MTSGSDFLLVTTGARPVGLGGAFSALADDLNALNSNPAGLASLDAPEVGYARYQSFSDIHYDFVGAALPVRSFGVLALGYQGMGIAPFNSTADPLKASVSVSDMAILMAWGRQWTPWLQGGLETKILRRKANDVSGMGAAVDLGVILKVAPRVSVALAGQNLGPALSMVELESLPAVAKVGVSVNLAHLAKHRLDWAGEGSMNMLSRRPLYGTGAEYWYRNEFAARVGYVGNGGSQGVAAGMGARVKNFQLDYAFQPYADLGSTHRVSGLYRFNDARRKTPAVKTTKLGKPEGLHAEIAGQDVTIRWTAPAGNVRAYMFTVSREGLAARELEIKGTSVLVNHLKAGVDYDVAVRAVDVNGVSGSSQTLRFQIPQTP